MIAAIAVPNRRPFAPAVLFLVAFAHVLLLARVNSAMPLPAGASHSRGAMFASVAAPLVMLTLAPLAADASRQVTIEPPDAVPTKHRPAATNAGVKSHDSDLPASKIEPINARTDPTRNSVAAASEFSRVPLSDENLAALDSARESPAAAVPAVEARAVETRAVEARTARGSHVFGGNFAPQERDHTGAINPSSPPRSMTPPLAAYVREGAARGAYAIGAELAHSGDGRCELQINSAQDAAPSVTCSTSELAAASERVPSASLASLATWLRSGLVRAIEINVREGRVAIDLRQ